jgi:hypothetical protein
MQSNELKTVKQEYKAAKQTEKYRESKNNLLSQLMRSPTPNWGSIVIKLVD